MKSILFGALIFLIVSVVSAILMSFPDKAFFQKYYEQAGPLFTDSFLNSRESEGDLLYIIVWYAQKILFALGLSCIYSKFRLGFKNTSEWKRGILCGFYSWILVTAGYIGMANAFSTPVMIWIWWSFYYLVSALAGGAFMSFAFRESKNDLD